MGTPPGRFSAPGEEWEDIAAAAASVGSAKYLKNPKGFIGGNGGASKKNVKRTRLRRLFA